MAIARVDGQCSEEEHDTTPDMEIENYMYPVDSDEGAGTQTKEAGLERGPRKNEE